MTEPGAGAPSFEDALRRAAKLVLVSYLISILGAIVIIAFIFLAIAGIFENPEEAIEGLEAIPAANLALLLLIGLIAYLVFVAAAYIYYKAFSGLRQALPWAPEGVRLRLELPVTILYYSALTMLAGVVLAIILVGLLLVFLASIGMTIGNILLGLALRGVGGGLETPGTLLVIGSALQVLALLPFLGILSLVGFILELVAYYLIYSWRGSLGSGNAAIQF